jgi:hypothetical protein
MIQSGTRSQVYRNGVNFQNLKAALFNEQDQYIFLIWLKQA